jgi:hypothetical protein
LLFPIRDFRRREEPRQERQGGFWHGEAEADLATLGGGTGLAAGALHRGFMGAQAADFFKDAVHFETGFETLESTVNGFAFADLNFGHKSGLRGGVGKRAARVGAGRQSSNGMSCSGNERLIAVRADADEG